VAGGFDRAAAGRAGRAEERGLTAPALEAGDDLLCGVAGAVAFSRQGSPDLGEFEDAVILKVFGDVPDDFRFVR
jgi:hypothetical protein